MHKPDILKSTPPYNIVEANKQAQSAKQVERCMGIGDHTQS